MSSVGQAVGGIVGGVIGLFVGMPALGAQIGMMIGGAIDPPKGPTINGPRLDDLSVQTSTYGAPIPRNYGTIAQTGNIFWLQGDKLTEVQTVTESGGKGGPVTTTKTWSYFATFAVGLCQGPIDGVRRIWIGGQLWYDAGSDDIAAIISSNQKSNLFTLYLGTDTQNADPLIQADKGVANTPAYRGLAYIVFDALPLEKYSNSLMGAQVKAEIVKVANTSVFLQETGSGVTGTDPQYVAVDADYAYVVSDSVLGSGGGTLEVFSTANVSGAPPRVASISVGNNPRTAVIDGSNIYITRDDIYDGHAMMVFSRGQTPRLLGSASIAADSYGSCVDSGYFYHVSLSGYKLEVIDVTSSVNPMLIASITVGAQPKAVAVANGYAYVACSLLDAIEVYDVSDPHAPTYVTSVAADDAPVGISLDSGYAHVINFTSGIYQIFDLVNPALPALVGTLNIFSSGSPRSIRAVGNYAYIVSTSGNLTIVDASNPVSPSVLITMTTAASANGVDVNGAIIAVVGFDDTIRINVFSPNHISGTAAQLGDIVEAECLTSNILTAGDLDVTALTDEVRGYRVAQLGAIRGALDPLRAAFPFDVVQHGYQIKFVRRGGASVASIPTSALDARAAGASPGVQVTDAREMDLMLPRKVSVNYVDVTREYETNQQPYERINTDAIGERAVDLPIVFSAAEAAQAAEMLTYLYWMERHDVAFVLPPEYDDLEPADVITLTGTDATWELRLLSTNTLPDGRIECRAKYNKAAIYTPVARGEEGQSTGGLLTLAGPCVYSLLDIPLMRDDDDTAGFPVAMSGYLSGWPGGILYRSDDSGQTWTDLRAFAPGAVMGYASTSLAAHGGTVYDFASTLAIRLYSGTLSSVTEAQLFAGQNWFAYGIDGRWEIIAARTATLQVDGSYVLQDFLRGQHGTEWATGLHASNDRIVLLSATALSFISVNASSIGSARTYRAITTGKALDSDSSLAFTYRGVNLECLSPVGLTGNRHPSTSDWTLTWIRRSRMPGWYDLVDVPLGETSESYEIDVYSDATYTTVKRTLTAATPTVAYTSAQQVTDFAGNQATLYLKLYQLSATVGRGYALTQSITR